MQYYWYKSFPFSGELPVIHLFTVQNRDSPVCLKNFSQLINRFFFLFESKNTFLEISSCSAKYYLRDEQGNYPVTNYMELEDIDLTKAASPAMNRISFDKGGDSPGK